MQQSQDWDASEECSSMGAMLKSPTPTINKYSETAKLVIQ